MKLKERYDKIVSMQNDIEDISGIDTIEYYKLIEELLCDICKEIGSIQVDFIWWVGFARQVIKMMGSSHYLYTYDYLQFWSGYIEKLVISLGKMIKNNKVDYVVCPVIQKGKFIGYKEYNKINGIWLGKNYKEYSNFSNILRII